MNKKILLTACTLMLVVTGIAMAGGPSQQKQFDAQKLAWKGEYYEYQFELYKNPPKPDVDRRQRISPPADTFATVPRNLSGGRSSSKVQTYSFRDLYENGELREIDIPESLRDELRGSRPSEQNIDQAIDCYTKALALVKADDYKKFLARAQNTKQEWLATGKAAWEKAQQEAQVKTLEDKFTVTLNAAGDGAVITKYSGDREVVGKTEYGPIYSSGDMVIPAAIQSFPVKEIGDGAFSNKRLTSVVIPEGVTRIGNDAFKDNRELITVTIPSTVTSVGKGAFSGCPNLDVPTQLALKKLGYKD